MCCSITLGNQLLRQPPFRSGRYESDKSFHSVVLTISFFLRLFQGSVHMKSTNIWIQSPGATTACRNIQYFSREFPLLTLRRKGVQRPLVSYGTVKDSVPTHRTNCAMVSVHSLVTQHTPKSYSLAAGSFDGQPEELSDGCFLRESVSPSQSSWFQTQLYTSCSSTEDSHFFLRLGIKVQHRKKICILLQQVICSLWKNSWHIFQWATDMMVQGPTPFLKRKVSLVGTEDAGSRHQTEKPK